MPSASFTDLEIRILQKLPEGYPVEITLGGQQEFPRGLLSSDILPWEASGDLSAAGQRHRRGPIRVLIVISNPSDLEEKYGLPQADVMLEEESPEEAVAADAVSDILSTGQ